MYAEENRREWQAKGESLVKEYVSTAREKRQQSPKKTLASPIIKNEKNEEQEEKQVLVWTPEGSTRDFSWV